MIETGRICLNKDEDEFLTNNGFKNHLNNIKNQESNNDSEDVGPLDVISPITTKEDILTNELSFPNNKQFIPVNNSTNSQIVELHMDIKKDICLSTGKNCLADSNEKPTVSETQPEIKDSPSTSPLLDKSPIKIQMTLTDVDYSFDGVSDRVKRLSSSLSLDHGQSIQTNGRNEKSISLIEPRKLMMDPQFKQKMKALYSPGLSSPNYTSETSGKQQTSFFPSHNECEIIEENLSPVSETARSLQKQLSFPSSPISYDKSPRIPKMTRFARLNRFLNQSSEPEAATSNETAEPN